MTELVRHCPNCGTDRPIAELFCEGDVDGQPCGYALADLDIVPRGAASSAPPGAPTGAATDVLRCPNGHPVDAGDQFCLECGADVGAATWATPEPPVEAPGAPAPPTLTPTAIDGWQLVERVATTREVWERFFVEEEAGGRKGLLTLYRAGVEPDPAVHEVLRRMPHDHIPDLLAVGRWRDRAYEVFERIEGGTLADAGWLLAGDPALFARMVDELGRALDGFGTVGLRHRDLRPRTILIRSLEPLDLVITSFGSARLSDFDLEAVAPLGLTRYAAPEAVVGGVSAASDWWSLGMILLEQATRGACFDGINDRAFHIHVVTRGMAVPDELDPRVGRLLQGLLARDPLRRWQWDEVRRWLAGEDVEPPAGGRRPAEAEAGPPFALGERTFARPEAWALAAAEAQQWEAARDLLLRGAVATWLEARGTDPATIAAVRVLAGDTCLEEDFRFGLVLMALNPALPLVVRGEIVTPAWLLARPEDGWALLAGSVPEHLTRMGREAWLVRLRTRADAARERARLLEVELDEERARLAMLTSSRANLEAERGLLRKIYPDADQPGLAALLDRSRLPDEDLIVLVGAARNQFVPLVTVADAAERLAVEVGIASWDRAAAEALLARPRRALYEEADGRTAGFARCRIERVDEWADALRVERRLPLARLVVLLAIPEAGWQAPPKQDYVSRLLEHFEKRVAGAVLRGPLVRFQVGKTTPRLDLAELGTADRPAQAMLDHLLRRDGVPVPLDPAAVAADPGREQRLRRLVTHAETFRRDTGIDGRYLGFPFLLLRNARAVQAGTRPRIAPVLLWPVRIDPPAAGGVPTLAFDSRRQEVRLNPALDGLLGLEEVKRWREARERVLANELVRAGDVVDAFGTLARPRGRTLAPLPGRDAAIGTGRAETVCAAALFNAEFIGQSLSEDLRQLRGADPAGTALEVSLRASTGAPPSPSPGPPTRPAERERFAVLASDPSQDEAVLRARHAPGLLVEGPPGTGKSQTIVNAVADAIGRGETVLVVCQKQAALRVVEKRLEAEGLGERLLAVTDANADRPEIIRALTAQLGKVRDADPAGTQRLRQVRETLARSVDTIEAEVDRHHDAVHAADARLGLSYRRLLGELVALEEGPSPPLTVTGLRPRFAALGEPEVEELAEQAGPLAVLWRAARFEGSALTAVKPFLADEAVAGEIEAVLSGFGVVEAERLRVLGATPHALAMADPGPCRAWLDAHDALLRALPTDRWRNLALWLDLFVPAAGGAARGRQVIGDLERLAEVLGSLDAGAHDSVLFLPLARQPRPELEALLALATEMTAPASFWRRLGPARRRRRRRLLAYLTELGQTPTEARMVALREAVRLELALRPVREAFRETARILRVQDDAQAVLALPPLRDAVQARLGGLRPLVGPAAALTACPARGEAVAMARGGTTDAYAAFSERLRAGFARHAARELSRRALDALEPWLEAPWLDACRARIEADEPTADLLDPVQAALPTLAAYQEFRLRARELPPAVLALFALLRAQERLLAPVPDEVLEDEVRRLLRREARLAWKAALEAGNPVLLAGEGELRRKVAELERLLGRMRELNRGLLAADIPADRLGPAGEWTKLLRHRGPGAKRLREILAEGRQLGLMALRPVWLLNPDVASSLLPRTPGMFDLVIFDEASQIVVENAVPALFRARRMVVSGDDKQMPPTSFFASRLEDDEEGELEALPDEALSEAELAHYEETWNRRDIKDCPDLLALARSVVPSTTLEIHYRSEFRELIAFSNAAFYRGGLSVPVRHPDDLVREVKPIEVIRADGTYEGQTNPAEAARVVELLAAYWARPEAKCPSIGVVTFNRKQADLIEDTIQERASADPAFLAAWQRERDRRQAGEDMGFFVKNVENVQGDERDVVIFSTTFGRDKRGSFRRNFGVLGQAGGERRLNVAITRARSKVVVVTSMPLNDVSDYLAGHRPPGKPRDYLQAYLDYAYKVSAGNLRDARQASQRLATAATSARNGSGHVDGVAASVERFLRGLGHEPVRLSDGDAFGLDFAIRHPRTGLFGIGIECDAPRHALLRAARAREVWRPKVLARTVPVVHRVTSRGWYHRREEEQIRLRTLIEGALGEAA